MSGPCETLDDAIKSVVSSKLGNRDFALVYDHAESTWCAAIGMPWLMYEGSSPDFTEYGETALQAVTTLFHAMAGQARGN